MKGEEGAVKTRETGGIWSPLCWADKQGLGQEALVPEAEGHGVVCPFWPHLPTKVRPLWTRTRSRHYLEPGTLSTKTGSFLPS